MIEIQHKCLNCDMRKDGFFCNFSDPVLKSFYSLKITNAYPKGATLFYEDEPSNGVYMLCQGRVKLSTYSRDGRALILRVAEAGEILGLSAAISDSVHEATAEAIEPCQINFVRKPDFLCFLRENADAGLNALRQLSRNYHAAYTQACSLGLSSTVSDKLIKLLLSWCVKPNRANGEVHLKVAFSHEDMAEMIGTSRETVTRLLKEFRELDLITLKGSDLCIHDRRKFEAAIGTGISPRHIL
jgi:CRP/FNR family cyclic AMP-dependent transcriptional regulator